MRQSVFIVARDQDTSEIIRQEAWFSVGSNEDSAKIDGALDRIIHEIKVRERERTAESSRATYIVQVERFRAK